MELRMTWTDGAELYSIMGTTEEINRQYKELIESGDFQCLFVEQLDETVI